MSAGSWRRRLALRIDPTLQHPLDVARATAAGWIDEVRAERQAPELRQALHTAANMLDKAHPTFNVPLHPARAAELGIAHEPGHYPTVTASTYFRAIADGRVTR